ncbi:MAG: glycosyltransferase family 4 protein [Actinomycetia bacterium]|nr:glycosyltransferase family 4 protein [Actinomycetes bacterium]MCH9699862.1 glycosyltransferase family 4 protein [Actinomycetes bacterium]MCH9760496.1 glycosyltransferase family 4 protein [Actinomycetes bacterium]
MSVALVSAVDPYPTDAGKKIVLAGFLDFFADRYGPDNVHYVKIGSPPQHQEFPVNLHVVPGPSRAAVLGSIATRVTTGRSSLQEAFLGSRRTGIAINRILDNISPQLRVYDTVRMAQYAPAQVAEHQICYLDDLFSERYGRMLTAAKRYPDVDSSPLGNFAEHVPRRLRPLGENKTAQTALLRLERTLVRRSEDRAARGFRRCLLVNEDEVGVLTRRTGVAPGRIQCVPPLLATAPASDRRYRGAPEFVFLGDLGLAHNDDGLRWFLREIWPMVLTRLPSAQFRVIGLNAGTEALALAAEQGDSVSMDGYVPDLAEALGQAAALVNPLRFGSGIKLKVIEALSRSLPSVSTPIGAEGISSGPGEGVLVGRGPAEVAELLCSLTDPERNAELSANARSHFLATYSRQAVFDAYDRAFGPSAP